jgi:flagellar motor switch protein FliN/FliY
MPDLSPTEIAALGDLLTSLSPNLALALAEQINREVLLDSPAITAVPIEELLTASTEVVQTTFSLSQPSTTESVVTFAMDTGRLFADLIEGNEGTDPPPSLLDDHMEKLAAAMSGFARGFATALTNLSGDTIDLESCTTTSGPLSLPPAFALEGHAIQATLKVAIPDLLDAELTFLFAPEFAQALVASPETEADESELSAAETSAADNIIGEEDLAAMLGSLGSEEEAGHAPAEPDMMGGGGGGTGAAPGAVGSPFAPFPAGGQENLPRGLELILDIPLDVTVELGRVRMLIKDVLELASGSIVELDRVAGEPVDLLVNGRLVAKGEVVVIEDNFGIRITEIISPADRVAGLGKGR